MNCPNCGAIFDGPHRFCGQCGTPLEYETQKKGTHRVPLLIMLALALVGLILFFTIPKRTVETPAQIIRWLTVDEGAVSFVEPRYQGGPEVEIPWMVNGQTVTAVDSFAFAYCYDITTVHLPNTVTHIGDHAFACCESLKVMELPEGVSFIGYEAFSGCTELEAIYIPASVTEIEKTAFLDCDSLGFIFYDGTPEQWDELYPHLIDSRPMICTSDGDSFR